MGALLTSVLVGILQSLAALGLTAAVVWWLARRELIGRSFFSRVTFSYVGLEGEDGKKVVVNTLLDQKLGEVWLDNRILLRSILKAARACDETNPFVVLPPDEMYHVKSGVRHQLSERFADGIMDGAVGLSVKKSELLACLCFTPSDGTGIGKLRAFVIRPDVLERIGKDPETFSAANPKKPKLLSTIAAIHERWEKDKSRPDEEHDLIHAVRIYRRT